MADLIDRQELISWISKDPLFPQVERFGLTSVIESRPSVDAVSVVRCKDCRYHNRNDCYMAWELDVTDDNDYCSRAERQDNEEAKADKH